MYGFVQIPTGKTRFAWRTIPPTQRELEVLTRRDSSVEYDWLFPVTKNSSMPISGVADAHEAALGLSGIHPPFRLYDLRHTAHTRMAMAGIDLPTLCELAGHASTQMTMRYVHPTSEHKKSDMEKLAAFSLSSRANSSGALGSSAGVSTCGFQR